MDVPDALASPEICHDFTALKSLLSQGGFRQ